MSSQSASLSVSEEQGGGNAAGREKVEKVKEGLNPATLGAILKLTKTKALFVHFEIGFKRTAPRYLARAAETPQVEQGGAQPVLAFSAAAAPRQAPALLDSAAAPQATGDPGSSTSGSSLFVQLKGGVTVTPPDGYPPPP